MQPANATHAMRDFHSRMRAQMMEETKDEQQLEKLWGMNYLSGLSFNNQTVEIPSNFLMPRLEPKDLDDKYSSTESKENAPSDELPLDALHLV